MSSLQDPRSRILSFLLLEDPDHFVDSNVTKDDNVSVATGHFCYAGAKYPLTREFTEKSNDYVVTVEVPTTKAITDYMGQIIGYTEKVPVQAFTIDATGITGELILWKIMRELRYAVEQNWTGSYYSIDVADAQTRDMGGWKLYSQRMVLTYERAVDPAPTGYDSITYGHGFLDDFTSPTYAATEYTATGDGAADGTTIVNAAHTQAADYWNGYTVRMLTGTCAGETCYISDFELGIIALEGAGFSDQIETGDTYQISRYKKVIDGNVTAVNVREGDYLNLSCSATDGNAVAYVYITFPTAILGSVYPLVLVRYMTTGNATAKVEFVRTDGSDVILDDATSDSEMNVEEGTLTAEKTYTGVKLYCNTGAGHVYYDFVLVCKGAFDIPNFRYGFTPHLPDKDVFVEVPGMDGDATQAQGSKLWYAECGCDLSKGVWTREGEGYFGQVFYDITCNAASEPWQWFKGAFNNLKVRVSDLQFPVQSTSDQMNWRLHFKLMEKRCSSGSAVDAATGITLETYETRLGL